MYQDQSASVTGQPVESRLMQPFREPTKHVGMRGKKEIQEKFRNGQKIDCCGQKIISLINFLMSSHCTLDKDISLGDILKLNVYVGQPVNQIAPKATDKSY